MSFEVDHVFVAASRGAPEAEGLLEAGFTEGPANTHAGQGTACRRFFFEDSYLELIWVEEADEVSSPSVERTGLGKRAGVGEGVSHVGVCLRALDERMSIPVEAWSYQPPYAPEGMAIPIAVNSSQLHEPLLFFLPQGMVQAEMPSSHRNGARRITDVSIVVPLGHDVSPQLEWLAASDLVRVEFGDAESVAVELDGGRSGSSVLLETATPLRLSW